MPRTRRNLLRTAGLTTVAALPFVAGCAGPSNDTVTTTPLPPNTVAVEVGPGGRYVFEPGTEEPLRIDSGTTVLFVWKSNTHNIHVTSQPADANWPGHETIENAGYAYEYEFTVPGTYEYVCVPHQSLGMKGTIIVEE